MSLRIGETKRLYCHVMCNALQNDLYPFITDDSTVQVQVQLCCKFKKGRIAFDINTISQKNILFKKMRHNYSYLFPPIVWHTLQC
uniref:Uncharacterized protein n=1 Tax=Anguilla anguilla TaxID=7936 RepID=A0A0E9XP94_ANGAN